MVSYLEINNDILDGCLDERVEEWFGVKYGRVHDHKFGPFDGRVTKRLGSGKEISLV